jgi:hypothetical protein
MRKGIVVNVTAGDHKRLAAIVANRNSPQLGSFSRPNSKKFVVCHDP